MLGDWASVFQLLCAYTIILGGYAKFTEKSEQEAEETLLRAELKLTEITRNTPSDPSDAGYKVQKFEWLIWKELTPVKLNKHRKFITTWYWNKKLKKRKVDFFRNIALLLIGAVSFAILIASAAFKETEVPVFLGMAVALLLWGTTFFIMAWIWFEDFQLKRQIQLSEKPADDPPEPSHRPHRGMIYAITNHIRRM